MSDIDKDETANGRALTHSDRRLLYALAEIDKLKRLELVLRAEIGDRAAERDAAEAFSKELQDVLMEINSALGRAGLRVEWTEGHKPPASIRAKEKP